MTASLALYLGLVEMLHAVAKTAARFIPIWISEREQTGWSMALLLQILLSYDAATTSVGRLIALAKMETGRE